jgi:hypothetical protein
VTGALPIARAYRLGPDLLVVPECRLCLKRHQHGWPPGGRVSHCVTRDPACWGRNYELRLMTAAEARRARR